MVEKIKKEIKKLLSRSMNVFVYRYVYGRTGIKSFGFPELFKTPAG